MSKKLVWARRFAVVLPLLIAVAAYGQVGFTDDFESYTPGTLDSPWADWATGTSPAYGNTVVNDTTAHSGNQYMTNGGEPVRWFTNPLTTKDEIIDLSFYVRGDSGNIDFFAGTSDVAPGSQPNGQYANNIGMLNINLSAGTVSYGGGTMSLTNDGTTWNQVTIRLIRRSNSNMTGQGELFVNGTGSGVQTVWSLPAAGLDIIDFYAAGSFDDFSIAANGTADPLPGLPSGYVTLLPGAKGTQGGITTDGKYLYATGGSGTDGSLYRYDTIAGTWTQMTSRPTIDGAHDYQHEGHGIAVDSNGKIVVMAGDHFDTGCNAYVYDIATNTWSGPVAGRTPDTYELMHGTEAVGDVTWSMLVNSQGGFTSFSTTTGTFLTGQGTGPTPAGGNSISGDLAYAKGTDYMYKIGHNEVTGYGGLARFNITTSTWDPIAYIDNWTDPENPVIVPGTLSDLPVPVGTAISGEQNALTYIDPKFATIYVLHQSWGDAALYEIRVTPDNGGSLIAAVQGSDDLYQYNIATDTWTTLTDALGFTFGAGDDICQGTLVFGDTDRDGDVDGTDLAALGINWDPAGSGHTWAQGDFDGDGDIDGTDLAKIGLNWNPAGLGTVPEPVTMSLFGLGGLALLRRRRK